MPVARRPTRAYGMENSPCDSLARGIYPTPELDSRRAPSPESERRPRYPPKWLLVSRTVRPIGVPVLRAKVRVAAPVVANPTPRLRREPAQEVFDEPSIDMPQNARNRKTRCWPLCPITAGMFSHGCHGQRFMRSHLGFPHTAKYYRSTIWEPLCPPPLRRVWRCVWRNVVKPTVGPRRT